MVLHMCGRHSATACVAKKPRKTPEKHNKPDIHFLNNLFLNLTFKITLGLIILPFNLDLTWCYDTFFFVTFATHNLDWNTSDIVLKYIVLKANVSYLL